MREKVIQGSFVKAQRVIGEMADTVVYIKLSQVIKICSFNDNSCVFDSKHGGTYYVKVSHQELKNACDSFRFKRSEHWKLYGYDIFTIYNFDQDKPINLKESFSK